MIKIDPVFTLGLSYMPFQATSINLVGFRNVVGASSVPDKTILPPASNSNISQQFFQKVVAALSVGYENDTYFGTTTETPTNRVDDYFFLRPRLTYALWTGSL